MDVFRGTIGAQRMLGLQVAISTKPLRTILYNTVAFVGYCSIIGLQSERAGWFAHRGSWG